MNHLKLSENVSTRNRSETYLTSTLDLTSTATSKSRGVAKGKRTQILATTSGVEVYGISFVTFTLVNLFFSTYNVLEIFKNIFQYKGKVKTPHPNHLMQLIQKNKLALKVGTNNAPWEAMAGKEFQLAHVPSLFPSSVSCLPCLSLVCPC